MTAENEIEATSSGSNFLSLPAVFTTFIGLPHANSERDPNTTLQIRRLEQLPLGHGTEICYHLGLISINSF